MLAGFVPHMHGSTDKCVPEALGEETGKCHSARRHSGNLCTQRQPLYIVQNDALNSRAES